MGQRERVRSLTMAAVKRMKPPKEGRYEVYDAALPGFGIRVSSTGGKSWILNYRFNGRQRRISPGRVVTMDLVEAREAARTTLRQAAAGIDPHEAKRRHRAAPIARRDDSGFAPGTFGALAESFIKRGLLDRRTGKPLRRGFEVEQIIRRELLPPWGRRLIADLRKRDAIELTDALVDAGTPAAANRLYEIIRRIGNWAAKRDEIEVSPFGAMEPPAHKVIRERVLTAREIKLVWMAWTWLGYPFGPLQKLLLVTGQRRSEVAQMQWSELDIESSLWTIPGARTKNGREHEVPLSSLAMDIIEGLPRFGDDDEGDDDSAFLFTSTGGDKPVSGFSKSKKRTDELIIKVAEKADDDTLALVKDGGLELWRLHDLRRTLRTELAKLGVSDTVGEKVLNHAERDLLRRTYNVHEYSAEKRDALNLWAQRLRDIIDSPPENVVRFKEAG